MQKIFFPLFLLCLLVGSLVCGLDPRISHVEAQLSFLPPWCSPSIFFSTDPGYVFEGHHIEKVVDGDGRVVGVLFVKDSDGVVEDRVNLEWEKGHSIDRLVRVEGKGVTHIFEYDEKDCAVRHIVEGEASGKEDGEYETSFRFDESYRPVEIQEQNGRVRKLQYPDEENAFFVVVDTYEGISAREASTDERFDEQYEQIEDDGESLDINDLSGVTWRRTKKVATDLLIASDLPSESTTTIFGFDLTTCKDIVLRTERYYFRYDAPLQLSAVYDGEGSLVSKVLGTQEDCVSVPATLEEIQVFADALRAMVPVIWNPNDGVLGRLGRDCFGRITSIAVESEGVRQTYALSYDALDRLTGVEAQGDDTWRYTREYSLEGRYVVARYTRDGVSTEEREERTPYGGILFRKEEVAPGESFLTTFDDKGRATRIERSFNGNRQLVVEKQYEMADDGLLFKVTSRFPDLTSQIEERGPAGRVERRQWKDADGSVVLEEKTLALDSLGSTRVQRIASKEERVVEWKVGENLHLESSGGVFFRYDSSGRCICKVSPTGRQIHYERNAEGQMTRQFTDDKTIDYRFSYDDKGRIYRADDAVTGHTVVRDFDGSGRLMSDGEKGARVQASYDGFGGLLRLDLPNDQILRYSSGYVYKEGTGPSWSIAVEEPKNPKGASTMLMTAPSEMEFHDPLGSWKEKFHYDALNQLQKEEGEFHQTSHFDPFGIAKVVEGCRLDGDGNVLSFRGEDNAVFFEYDGLGRLINVKARDDEEHYRYDGFGRLQEITTSHGEIKRLCWLGEHELGAVQKDSLVELKVPHPMTWQPVAIEVASTPFRVEADERGSIIAVYDIASNTPFEVYRYSAFGTLHVYGASQEDVKTTALSPWLYCGKRILKATYDFGARRYSPLLMRWMEKDPLGLVDTFDDRIYARNNPIVFADPTGLFPQLIDWPQIRGSFSLALRNVASSAYKTVTFAKERFDWLLEFRSTYEDVFFQLLGRAWLRCSGYNLDSTSLGVYGESGERPKIRITMINGILNGASDAKKSAALLSSTHGGIPVHFVYVATQGFSGDLLRGAFAKAGLISRQSRMLVELWRGLFDEMKGGDGGGMILHYAHSLGATETLNALQLLEPEERACIRVVTLGSPTLIDEGVCRKVDNYVSTKDGIPIIDYHRYRDGAHGNRSNVHFVPSDRRLPFVDHYLDGNTYRGVLETLGQKFQEEFLLAQSA